MPYESEKLKSRVFYYLCTEGSLRKPPSGADQGRGDRGRRRVVDALHHLAVPARQGHRPGGRGGLAAAAGDELRARGLF